MASTLVFFMIIEFKHPDSFYFDVVKSPSKYFGKKVYSNFLKLPVFWYNRNTKKVAITTLSTLSVVVRYLVTEKGEEVLLSNSNDFIKKRLYIYSLWLHNQLLKE